MPMPPQTVHASPSSTTSSPSRSVQPEEQPQRVTSTNNSTSPSSDHHRLQPGLSSLFSRFTGRSRSTSTADQRSRAVGSPSATSSSGTTSSSASQPEDAKDRLASILASAKHRQSSPLARESSSGGGSTSKKGKKQPAGLVSATAPFLPAEGELQDEGPYAPTSPYVFLEHLARFDKGDDAQERLNLIQSLSDSVILFDEIDSLQVWFAAPACSLLDASAEPLFVRLAGIKLLCTCIAASESSLHVASRKIAFYNSVCRYAVETKDCTDQELDGLTQALSALCKGGRDVSALDGLVERTCDFAGEKFKRRQAERDQIRVAFFDQHPQLSRLQFVSDADRNDIAPPLLDPAQASVFVSWPYASARAGEPSIKSPAMTLLSNVHKFGWPLLSHDAICFATAYLVAEALATSNDTIVRSIIDHMDVISRFGYVPSSQIQGVVFFLARVVATEGAQRVIKFCDDEDHVLPEPELHPLPPTLADEAKRVTNNLLRSTANQALAQLREGTKPPSVQEPQRDLNVVVGCLRCLREAMGKIRASVRQFPDAAAAANSTYLDTWPILLSLGIPLFFNNLWDALEWSSPAVNVEVLRIILDRLIESTCGGPEAAASEGEGSPSSSSGAGEKLTFEEWDMILDLLHEIQRHIQRFEEEDKVLWMLNLSKARPENYDPQDLSHDTSGLDAKSAVLTLYRRILHYIVQSYLSNALDASTDRLFYVLYSLGPNLTDESVVLLIDGYIKENICLPSNPEWIEDLNDIVYGFLMTDASDLTASQSLVGEQRDPEDVPDMFSQRPIRPMARFKSLQLVSDVYQSVRDFEDHRVLLVDRIVIPTIDHLLSAGVEPKESQVLNHLISSVAKDAFRNLEEAPEKSKKILIDLTAALVEASTTAAHPPRQGRTRREASPSRKPSDPVHRSEPIAPTAERIRASQLTSRPAMADFATIKLLDMFTIGLSTSGAHAARESVTIFRQLLSLLRDQTTPRRTRFCILQYVLRLRATARHRVSLVRDVDIFGLAEIVSRTPMPPQPETDPPTSREANNSEAAETGGDRRRGRKITTNSSPDRRYSRSKSRIRFKDRSVSTQLRVANDPLWYVPEVLPFSIPAITGEESVGLVSFDHTVEWSESLDVDPSEADFDNYTAALAARPEGAPVLLPVSEYLQTLQSLLRADTDWDLSAYILCHLPVQLSCKHFFAGPRASRQVKAVRDLLAEGLMSNTLGARTLLPEGNRRADLPSLAYHTLATLTAYKSLFSKAEQDELVQTFATGLTQREVAKPCIHALAMACHELQPSMTKHLSQILANLLKIMSTARMAVHILELIASIGHLPSLSSSFTSDDYRTVLGIALQYIALHNDRTALSSTAKDSATPSKAEDIEHAFAQYVFHLAYIVIELWYLRMRLPQRRQQAPFIVRKLLQANEGRGCLDEASEVCLDMIARYGTGDIDPRPKRSGLKETLWNGSAPGQSLTRTWIQGHAVMSIRCLANTRWAEVVVRRPSGVSHLLLEVANTLEPAIETVSAEMLETVLKHRESLSTAANASLPEELSSMNPDGVVTLQQIRDKVGAQIPASARSSDGKPEEDPSDPSQTTVTSSVTPSYFALQLSAFPEFGSSGPPLQVPDEDRFQRSIRNLDAVPVVDFHKIGVIYVGQDDETEKDILSNTHGSKDYVNLLSSLGDIVRLRNNTEVYLGGLDRDSDLDGKWAYVWSSSGVQMVYHVATLMPTRQDTDPQCIGKKRHIGNDFVKIIFNDSGRPFHSDMLPGQFNFVDIVIEPQTPAGKSWTAHGMSSNTAFFKVSMQRRVDMPEIGPLGVFKMVSAKSLSDCVRHLALHANIFAQVFLESVGIEGGRGGTRNKTLYVSNWGRRLQHIKQLRERVGSRNEQPSQTEKPAQPINLDELAQSLDLSRWAYPL